MSCALHGLFQCDRKGTSYCSVVQPVIETVVNGGNEKPCPTSLLGVCLEVAFVNALLAPLLVHSNILH
jgi:hypothetical protein